jgi:hypothetical protein
MNIKPYIKLVLEARAKSEHREKAEQMNDDELVIYIETLVSGYKQLLKDYPVFYQYLLKNRPEVLKNFKSKFEKGEDYYKNLVSQYDTVGDFRTENLNTYTYIYQKFGKDKAKEILSNVKNPGSHKGRTSKSVDVPTSQVNLQNTEDILKNYQSFEEFQSKNTKFLFDLLQKVGNDEYAKILSNIESEFNKNKKLSVEEVEELIGKYKTLEDFKLNHPDVFLDLPLIMSQEKAQQLLGRLTNKRTRTPFNLQKVKEILLDMKRKNRSATEFSELYPSLKQGILRYFGANGFYVLTKDLKREKSVSDPKRNLPYEVLTATIKKYKTPDAFYRNEKEFIKKAENIYGTTGLKKNVYQALGMAMPEIQKRKQETPKSATMYKGKLYSIPTKKIRAFLSNYQTADELREKEPLVYQGLERMGILSDYYGV